MTFFKSLVLSAVVLTTSFFTTASVTPDKTTAKTATSRMYSFYDFAKYMGMTPQEYFKFSGAYAVDNASPELPDFVDIKSHPAFKQAKKLQSEGLPVPQSLTADIEALFKQNQALFADYMQMDIAELVRKQDRFDNLTLVLNGLDANANKPSPKKHKGVTSDDNDEIAVIEVSGNKNSILKTTSGIYTSLTERTHELGMGVNDGSGGIVKVNYYTENGYYRSQEWKINRFSAYPTGDIFCNPETC